DACQKPQIYRPSFYPEEVCCEGIVSFRLTVVCVPTDQPFIPKTLFIKQFNNPNVPKNQNHCIWRHS
ncbi:hypothetical protein, partial [Rhodonellum psychrophilum]|uniref:hypothetical protein n=1 Tax=Rhodonellum psychrophilum TaxID=336828 RepID=UPI001F2E6129